MLKYNLFHKFLSSTQSIAGQSRKTCTVIVERVFEPNLPKLGKNPKLKPRHKIYQFKRNQHGNKELKVILTKDSTTYGIVGEIVNLPKYFARQLLYQNEAIYASPKNIEEFGLKQNDDQTVTGRRMIYWLKSHPTFEVLFPENVEWKLETKTFVRSLQRSYDIMISPEAVSLPTYEINNKNAFDGHEHLVKLIINGLENVEVKVKFLPKKNASLTSL